MTAEVHTLTLKQAIAHALAESPDAVMARMDEIKAAQGVQIAREPFTPRVTGGSGLAWSNGFPLSIEGSAPSVFEAKTSMSLFNKPQMFAVGAGRARRRGARVFAGSERREEVVYRVAALYIDVDRATRLAEGVQKQVESLGKVLAAVNTRVEAGRELPVTRQEANVIVLRARQRLMALQAERDYAEHNLAAALGFNPR